MFTRKTSPGILPKGGTSLYGLYRYVRPQRVWFSAVLVINRASILDVSVDWVCFLKKKILFDLYR